MVTILDWERGAPSPLSFLFLKQKGKSGQRIPEVRLPRYNEKMTQAGDSAAELLLELESRLKADDWSERAWQGINELYKRIYDMDLREEELKKLNQLMDAY